MTDDSTKTRTHNYRPPAFPLGQLVSTPGALKAIGESEIAQALARHLGKDWGDCCPDDWASNDRALVEGDRLFSVYHSSGGAKFWIITEANRAATTVLLPNEY
jgi:hypothetical protein